MQNKKNFAFGHCLRSEGIVCMKSGPRKESRINRRIGEKTFEFTSLCVSQTAIKR